MHGEKGVVETSSAWPLKLVRLLYCFCELSVVGEVES